MPPHPRLAEVSIVAPDTVQLLRGVVGFWRAMRAVRVQRRVLIVALVRSVVNGRIYVDPTAL